MFSSECHADAQPSVDSHRHGNSDANRDVDTYTDRIAESDTNGDAIERLDANSDIHTEGDP